MDEVIPYFKAMVYLQAQLLVEDASAREKPEVVMSRAGLTHKEIAVALGRSEPAVAKSISRANQSKMKEKTE